MKKIGMFVLFSVSFFFLLVGTSYSADIDELNAAIKASGGGWVAGETSVSKLPPELKRGLCGLKYDTPEKLKGHMVSGRPKSPASSSFGTSASPACSTSDPVCVWTNRNGLSYVTSVKDQGQCGSCWAFSSTAAAESESLISFNRPGLPLNLSEQIVLSCTGPTLSLSGDDCAGGYPSDAGTFLQKYGTNVESCSPYVSYWWGENPGSGAACDATYICGNWFSNPSTNYYINSWSATCPTYSPSTTSCSCPSWGSATLSEAVATVKSLLAQGPVVGTMEVYEDFEYYTGGVYYLTEWGYDYSNGEPLGGHAIEIVGWNDNLESPWGAGAFYVKNSWGTGWGIGGFFWIAYEQLLNYPAFACNTYFFNGGTHTPIMNFASVPSGLQFSINGGAPYATPQSLEVESGSVVSVATSQSGSSGCQYVFTHWSTGALNPTFIVPLVGQSYTAYFKTQYQLTTNASGSGIVLPASGNWYNANAVVPISAKPVAGSGYTFYGWTVDSVDVTGAKNPSSIVMNAAHSVTANFAQFSLTSPTVGSTISLSTQSPYTIQWNGPTSSVTYITYNIFYSLNGGVTWKTIATAQTGLSYSWTVPFTVTKPTKCWIKVVARNGATAVKVLGSGAFTITP